MYFCAAEHPNPEIANNRVINMKQQQLDQVDSQITALQDVPTVNLRIWDLGSGLAALFTYLGFSVDWIFGALIGDYIIKASMLTHRFRSGRWKNKMKRYH